MSTHRLARLFVLAASATASLSAAAHAILVDSTPALNGSLKAGHASLVLKFNSKVDPHRSRLVLVGPDQSTSVLEIAGDKPGNELDASADLVPGAYTVRWQALAVDGHITRGDLPFTVVAGP